MSRISSLDWFDKRFHPSYGAIMTTKIVLDKAGRVVIPKRLGDSLQLESAGDQITLRPVRGSAQASAFHLP